MAYDLRTLTTAALWPHRPDWSAGYRVTRSFRTDIITARSGVEQRRALRDTPRLSLHYRIIVEGDSHRAASHFLHARHNRPAMLPDFSRYAPVRSAVAAGAGTLVIAPLPAWIARGQWLVLCGAGHRSELVCVGRVAGSTITFSRPPGKAWPAGSSIRPAIPGLLNGSLSSRRFRRDAAGIRCDFDAYPGGEPPEDRGASVTTLGGRDVFPTGFAHMSAPALENRWPVEQVDYHMGRTAQFRPVTSAGTLSEYQLGGLAPASAHAIEQAFLRARGRRGTFWLPTGEKDCVLAVNAAAGSTDFLVQGIDIARDFGRVPAGKPAAIAICLTDGTRLHHLIAAIAPAGGNSRITLTTPLANALTIPTITSISWMPLVRFASDEMSTKWRTPRTAAIGVRFQSVRE